MLVVQKAMAVAALALTALAVTGAGNAATGWKTVAIGQDADTSEYAYMSVRIETKLLNVRGLQLRTTTLVPLKVEVTVDCEKGEAEASRKAAFSIPAGTTTKKLPVPIAGGKCEISAWLNSGFSTPGAMDARLQVRS